MDEQYPLNLPFFPARRKELVFGGLILLWALALSNFILYGGFNLGFALAETACMVSTAGYLLCSGRKGNWYSWSLLTLSAAIALGFARSDDGFVKFVMVCFLFVSGNLGLSVMAEQNRWAPASVGSLLDPFRTCFSLGVGRLPEAFRGLSRTLRGSGRVGKISGGVLLGIVIAVPILAILIPLLVSADAAFDGLVRMLPQFDLSEAVSTVLLGAMAACVLYTRGTALCHQPRTETAPPRNKKGLSILTVNTVLGAISFVYLVYLVSQLAYFIGGFAGILPEGYTTAEYARRGFFEMAWLCILNLSIMIFGVGVTAKKKGRTPLPTRILCLFVGIVTLFFVIASGAKMWLYIGTFGLTRLRVLTMVIMVFLGITTALVSLWLFLPKIPYMKGIMLAALVIGAAVIWADVDTQVARYNVNAYLSGKLETVDVAYLANDLGSGAVPYLYRLSVEAPDEAIRLLAEGQLRGASKIDDFREWNYADYAADAYLTREVTDIDR